MTFEIEIAEATPVCVAVSRSWPFAVVAVTAPFLALIASATSLIVMPAVRSTWIAMPDELMSMPPAALSVVLPAAACVSVAAPATPLERDAGVRLVEARGARHLDHAAGLQRDGGARQVLLHPVGEIGDGARVGHREAGAFACPPCVEPSLIVEPTA